MGTESESRKYSKHSLMFAEYICNNYMYYRALYDDLVDTEIYRFTSKEISTKINLYRASDTTAEAALKLAESKNREIQQVAQMINSVRKVFRKLDNTERRWAIKTLIFQEGETPKRDLEEKRIRNKILTNICTEMGFPESLSRKTPKEKKVEICAELSCATE